MRWSCPLISEIEQVVAFFCTPRYAWRFIVVFLNWGGGELWAVFFLILTTMEEV